MCQISIFLKMVKQPIYFLLGAFIWNDPFAYDIDHGCYSSRRSKQDQQQTLKGIVISRHNKQVRAARTGVNSANKNHVGECGYTSGSSWAKGARL